MSKVEHNRSYWPEKGTTIKAFEVDLMDIWETHEDAANIFVAESLIANPPTFNIDFGEDIVMGVFLWDVGGDTLTVKQNLIIELEESFEMQGGAGEDPKKFLVGLQKLKDKVTELIQLCEKETDS